MKGSGERRVPEERVESDIEQHVGQVAWTALSTLLEGVLQIVRQVAPSTSSSITLVNAEGAFISYDALDEIADRLDAVQSAAQSGPSVEATSLGKIVASTPEAHPSWAQFWSVAGEVGVTAALSIPLRSGDTTYGALNVYATEPGPISEIEAGLARTLADHISNALALIDASALNTQLQEAITTRQLIGEAKGILMESESCTRDQAFDLLRRASQRTNRKLRDIAQEIVDAAERRAQDPT